MAPKTGALSLTKSKTSYFLKLNRTFKKNILNTHTQTLTKIKMQKKLIHNINKKR